MTYNLTVGNDIHRGP